MLLSKLPELIEGHDIEMAELGLELVELFLVYVTRSIVDDIFKIGGLPKHLQQELEEAGVQENRGAVSLTQGVPDTLLAQGIIGCDDGNGLGCSAYTNELVSDCQTEGLDLVRTIPWDIANQCALI